MQLSYIYSISILFSSYKWVVPFTYLTDDSSLKSKPLNLTKGEKSFGGLTPSPKVVLLPCLNQMNLARQRHDKRTTVVSNVEFKLSRAEDQKKFASLKAILNARK